MPFVSPEGGMTRFRWLAPVSPNRQQGGNSTADPSQRVPCASREHALRDFAGAAYVYWSAGLFFGLVTPLTVAFTSTFPFAWAGLTSVQVVTVLHVTSDAGVGPNVTLVVSTPTAKPLPVMLTAVAPALVPELGLTVVTVGVKV
jgi:hypothetical protein